MSMEKPSDATLIGYLLNALDEATQAQVHAQLDADMDLYRRLESLRAALEPLEADREVAAPPPDLTVKTLARVAEYCCRELPRAPVLVRRGGGGVSRNLWRRVDVVVAACLALTTLGLLLPALLQAQSPRSTSVFIECQNNLRVFYTGLDAYRTSRGHFPNLAAQDPIFSAGMVLPLLAQAGVLPADFNVHCPGTGPRGYGGLTLDQARSLNPASFQCNSGDYYSYAYSLGYKNADGCYFGPTQFKGQPANMVALMADVPPQAVESGRNSPNHGGAGQYVLFFDGSVRFTPIRTIGYQWDDIYLNKNHQVAAGLDNLDIVLGRSTAKPSGPQFDQCP